MESYTLWVSTGDLPELKLAWLELLYRERAVLTQRFNVWARHGGGRGVTET